MTKEGYTHIIVPKELHAILKGEAEERDMSISKYIENILSQIKAIEELLSINTEESRIRENREYSGVFKGCVDRDLNPGCRLGRPKSYL
jgi:hypothetical protein